MKLLAIILLAGAVASANAQTIVLKTGQRVETLGVRRSGDLVMGKIEVAGSKGEIGYQVAQIGRIEFPEPKELRMARDLLTQAQPEKAMAAIDPAVALHYPFRDVPGNYWAAATLVKVNALAALKRNDEAESLAREIQRNSTDPDMARAAELRLAGGFIRKQQFDRAAQICDAAIEKATDPAVIADAWVLKGDTFSAQKKWDEALLAYLHVPVFHPDQKRFLAEALLGSARAYRRLEDLDRARKTFNEVIATYPKTAYASDAQKELQKLPK